MMSCFYRPRVEISDIPDLVRSLYAVDVTVVKELDSYDDQNFLVKLVSKSAFPENTVDAGSVSNSEYVFKIINSLDSRKPNVIDAQTELILHAKRASYPTPGLIRTVDQKHQTLVDLLVSHPDGPRKEKCVVRLFEFMPGITLDQVALTPQLSYEIGIFAGRLDVILQSFPLDKYPVCEQMERKWNLTQVPSLLTTIHAVQDPEQVKLCREVIDSFDVNILQCQDKFTKGMIHSDFNDCNIIVHAEKEIQDWSQFRIDLCETVDETNENNLQNSDKQLDKTTEKKSVLHLTGLLDYGDCTFSLYLFEIAIAISYAMLKVHDTDGMTTASWVLAGYLKAMNLPLDELKFLKVTVCARFVQSLILGYFSSMEDPENDYILHHAAKIWPILKRLWEAPDKDILYQFLRHTSRSQYAALV